MMLLISLIVIFWVCMTCSHIRVAINSWFLKFSKACSGPPYLFGLERKRFWIKIMRVLFSNVILSVNYPYSPNSIHDVGTYFGKSGVVVMMICCSSFAIVVGLGLGSFRVKL